ncbi:MAG: sulfatase-like hydrolase/transferase [Kiritimatiellia bacterium]
MKKTVVIIAALVIAAVGVWLVLRPRPMNLLMITLDTTRADYLGCYGKSDAATPNLDRLAREGVLFEYAYSGVPLTLPSHTTMMTGLRPPEHNLRINGENALNPEITTLAEIVGKRGYRTGAFIASFVLDARFGLSQGFEEYNDDVTGGDPSEEGLRAYRPGSDVADAVIPWIESTAHRPFFCWVHFFDPHKPYHEHRNLFGDVYAGRPYEAEIAYMDQQIGRIIKTLENSGRLDRTLIVVVGDHGESLGEHNELYHGNTLYNSGLHVPLIFRLPGKIPAGRRFAQRISLDRIFPTALDVLRVKNKNNPLSLAAAVSGAGQVTAFPIHLETDEPWRQYGWHPLRGLIENNLKYIRSPRVELYDLQADPRELNDLAPVRAEEVVRMESVLASLESGMTAYRPERAILSKSDEQILTSLGYTAGASGEPDSAPAENLPDVKDMLPLLNQTMFAKTLLNQNKPAEAAAILEEVRAVDARNAAVELVYAEALHNAGRFSEAVEVLTNVVQNEEMSLAAPTRLDSMTLLGKCYYAMRRPSDSVAALREALRLAADSTVALNGLAWVLATDPNSTASDRAEAVRLAEEAVRLRGGTNPSHLDTLSVALAASGRRQEARSAAEKALKLAEEQGNMPLAGEIRARLKKFQ